MTAAMDDGDPRTSDVSTLLAELRGGDRSAVQRLFPLVYEELKRIAQMQRQSWQDVETLNTTALVHEAYVKLARGRDSDWRDRAHFLAVAATAMRSILVDHARAIAHPRFTDAVEMPSASAVSSIDIPP